MDNIIYNTTNKENNQKILNYILENKNEAKIHFNKTFDFVCKYPFVLKYEDEEYIPDEICKCCNQEIANTNKRRKWGDGFRPKIKDIVIDLHRVARIVEESKKNKEFEKFVHDFVNATN